MINMSLLGQILSIILGLRRTFDDEYRSADHNFKRKNLLGATFYNYGTSPVKIFDFELRAYDSERGPDAYVLDTLPYCYDDDMYVPIKFTGDPGSTTNKVYITYSCLKKC